MAWVQAFTELLKAFAPVLFGIAAIYVGYTVFSIRVELGGLVRKHAKPITAKQLKGAVERALNERESRLIDVTPSKPRPPKLPSR